MDEIMRQLLNVMTNEVALNVGRNQDEVMSVITYMIQFEYC